MRLLRILTLVTLSLFLAGAAHALDINKDFWNQTGSPANDCEVIIGGWQTLTCVYDGDTGMEFPDFAATQETIDGQPCTVLRWSGLMVLPGQKVHLGFCTPDGVILGMRWTLDGVPVGPVTQVDVRPSLTGVGLVVNNSLTLSLWPVTWPIVPPPVYIGDVTAYYFSSVLPIGSLNNAMLPLWSPLATTPVRTGWAPAVTLASGASTEFAAPAPPAGAVVVVWVMDVGSSASPTQASRDFVQFPLSDPVPAADATWGRIKTLYR